MFAKSFTSALLLLSSLAFAAPITTLGDHIYIHEVSLAKPRSLLDYILPRSSTQDCDAGVRVWGVRGSTAQRGNNPMATFAHEVAQSSAHSFGSDLPYPASDYTVASVYQASVTTGVSMLTDRIQKYVDRCPGHKIAILGFSQGAQVVADTLIGGNMDTVALGEQYRSALAAVVTFGDPSWVPNISGISAGSSTTGGVVHRTNYLDYHTYGYTNRVMAFCAEGDWVCSSGTGPDAYTIHDNEPNTYGAEAVAWMKTTIAAALMK